MQDMLDRGAARKVSQEEISKYGGAQFYIAHHAVFKPESKSTPCRIVFNSSAKYAGLSLNDCLAKGPSLLNMLLGILLRFRQGKVAFVGDISKMFHSIEIPVEDQMTHLFLWRGLDTKKEPETYAITAVNMGDRPSATIAQIALRKTAEAAKEDFPEAAEIILQNSYMDDIPGSADSHEKAKQYMGEIEAILGKRSFRIKEWIFPGYVRLSGNHIDQKQVQILMGMPDDDNEITEGILGMKWDIEKDILRFNVNEDRRDMRRN